MLNLVADENIAFAEEAFSTLGRVISLPGRDITNTSLRETDILLVRSVTKVDHTLLDNTRVKFIGTATIGTDHIDLNYLKSKGIQFADAKGCNADAVAEYVFTALYHTAMHKGLRLKDLSLGIIGVGNIGSRVARIAGAAGMKVMLNDPPLKRLTGSSSYLELEKVLDADIITLHVPLSLEGKDKTAHLIDETILNLLKDNSILINSSRGEVIDNKALQELHKPLTIILDVWENEPVINQSLAAKAFISTPHIAGYSLEGKVNGTVMIYRALCSYLGVSAEWKPLYPGISEEQIRFPIEETEERQIHFILSSIYDIKKDDEKLRSVLSSQKNAGHHFDQLRKNYPLRREFSNYRITGKIPAVPEKVLKALRFGLT